MRPFARDGTPCPGQVDAPRIYVYGLIRVGGRAQDPELPALTGIAGNPTHVIACDGLAALVSALPMHAEDDWFESAIDDPERIKGLILDHHRVLQAIISDHTVLPARFGTLFANETHLVAALRRNSQSFHDALGRVEGAREWGVKIFSDRSVLRDNVGKASPVMRAAEREIAAAAEGRGFFLRRRLGQLGDDECERAVARCVETTRLILCADARADATLRLQPEAAHMGIDEMVWNGTLLVDRAAEQRFFASIEELRKGNAPRGFRYELSGPWPPFSFADCRLREEEDGRSNIPPQ